MIQPNSTGIKGGARPGAGRPKGSVSKTTKLAKEAQARAVEAGVTPLEYMLAVMRADSSHDDPKVEIARESMRFEAAKAAAPYIHPRLAAVEVTGQDGGPVKIEQIARTIIRP